MIDALRILPMLLSKAGEQPEFAEIAVKIAWARAAGAGLREHAVPFRLEGKTLIVSVADAIWQKQLRTMGREFVSRTNRLLGQPLLDAIDFRVEPTIVNRARPVPQRVLTSTAGRAIPTELIAAAASISDNDLRERFMRAAENCIARRDSQTA
jgi:hypothetical protein